MSEPIPVPPNGGAAFFGFMGVSLALVLASTPLITSDFGAAYGTAKAGTGISSISLWRPNVVMKSLIPVVMAGILGIYGMIVAVIISQRGTIFATKLKTQGNTPKEMGFRTWPRVWSADSAAW